MAEKLNIVIEQGATSRTTLIINHAVRTVCPVLPNAVLVKCSPLTADIPDAFSLKFKLSACQTIELITDGVTLAGAETINIQPYLGTVTIPALSRAKIAPIDLTGEIWRGACRKRYSDSDPLFTWGFEITPLQGLVIGTVPDEVTEAIVVGDRERVTFLDIPEDIQSDRNFTAQILAKSWYYDWEREYPDGTVDRVLQGRVWMPVEATK
jgi:hypothetical protein